MTRNSWAGVGGGALSSFAGVTRNICVPPKPECVLANAAFQLKTHGSRNPLIICVLTYNRNHLFFRGDKRDSCGWVGWGQSRKWALGEEGSTFRKTIWMWEDVCWRRNEFIVIALEVRFLQMLGHCVLYKMVQRRNCSSLIDTTSYWSKRELLKTPLAILIVLKECHIQNIIDTFVIPHWGDLLDYNNKIVQTKYIVKMNINGIHIHCEKIFY